MFFFGAARAAGYRPRTTLTHSFILHEGRGRPPTQDVSNPICNKIKFYKFLSLALPGTPPAFWSDAAVVSAQSLPRNVEAENHV